MFSALTQQQLCHLALCRGEPGVPCFGEQKHFLRILNGTIRQDKHRSQKSVPALV